MANAALFIGWGTPVHGREQKSLQVFNEVMQYYSRLQQQGEIESFVPVELEPHGGDLQGFVLIQGDRDKLARVRASEEFQHFTNRATLIVENFGVVSGYVGEELNKLFADFSSQSSELA